MTPKRNSIRSREFVLNRQLKTKGFGNFGFNGRSQPLSTSLPSLSLSFFFSPRATSWTPYSNLPSTQADNLSPNSFIMLYPAALHSLLLSSPLLTDAQSHSKRCEDAPLGGHLVDFSTFDPSQQTPEQFLNAHQDTISDYTVGEYTATTIPHFFEKPNVDIVNGALLLRAKGQAGNEIVSSSQVQSVDKFTFGTLETFAKATTTKGVCQ